MLWFDITSIILIVLFVLILGIASYTDIISRRIPNKLCVYLLILSIVKAISNMIVYDAKSVISNMLIGGLLSFIFVGIPYFVNKSLGAGDLKLSVPASFFLGYKSTLSMLFVSLFTCAIFSIICYCMNKAGKKYDLNSIPFAPFLFIGALYALITSFIQ